MTGVQTCALPISEHGFCRSEEDHSLFVHESRRLIILLYVDDLVLAAATQPSIEWAKGALSAAFEMTELGELKTFIGVKVTRDRSRKTLKVTQSSYVSQVLHDHGVTGAFWLDGLAFMRPCKILQLKVFKE